MKFKYVKWNGNIKRYPSTKKIKEGSKTCYIDIRDYNKYGRVDYNYTIPCCLDTETSHTNDNTIGWVYHFAINVGYNIYRGRNITDLINILIAIGEMYNTNDRNRLIIYVHNLSYDIVYLEHHIDYYIGIKSRLDIKSRKVLSVVLENGLELRCSYLLTGMSLDKFAKEMNTEHKKLTGAVNHNIIRYPISKLQITDILYMYNDITCLVEGLSKKMKKDNHTSCDIPYTKTGYVREYCKRKVKNDTAYKKLFIETKLDIETYRKLEKAYKGGYTHSSYKYRNKVVSGDIAHYDFRSHYPSVLMLEKYPMSKFKIDNSIVSISGIKRSVKSKAMLVTFSITNAVLKDDRYFPLLQVTDTINSGVSKKNIVNNNGRVQVLKGTATYTLTGEDFLLVTEMYNYSSIAVHEVISSIKGKIPVYLREAILEFFVGKTKYKDIDDYMCAHNKTLLNSLYGMLCTKLVRNEIEVNEKFEPHIKPLQTEEMEKILNKYYKNKNSFCMYQIGVWVTAYARKWLFDYFKAIGEENVLYCDTDSAFFIRNEENVKRIDELNNYWYNKAMKEKAYIKYNNKIVTFGAFIDENDNIVKFKTLHAKCYACINKYNRLSVTIAGVSKNGRNKNTIANELGDIDNLSDKFVFVDCGGTTSKYNNVSEICTYEYKYNEKVYHLEYANSCIICESEKQISALKE